MPDDGSLSFEAIRSRPCVWALLLYWLVGCGNENTDRAYLSLERVIELDLGGEPAARPEIFWHDGLFYVVYLSVAEQREFKFRIFGVDLDEPVGKGGTIANKDDYGDPTDIRGKLQGDRVFLLYEKAKKPNTHLFASAHTLDGAFTCVLDRGEPIARGDYFEPGQGTPYETEHFNDPTVLTTPDGVTVLTHVVTGVLPQDDTIYRMRRLAHDSLDVTEAPKDLRLGKLLDGMGGVANLLHHDGVIRGVFPHMFELGSRHGFRLIQLRDDLEPDPDSVLDLVDQGFNLHPTGFLFQKNHFFLSYSNEATTAPGVAEDERETRLAVFDQHFKLVQGITLDELGNHGTLTTDGTRLYLAYSSFQRIKVAVFNRQ